MYLALLVALIDLTSNSFMKSTSILMSKDMMSLVKETSTSESRVIAQDVKAENYQQESNTDSSPV